MTDLGKCITPNNYREKQLVLNCLELVEAVIVKEDISSGATAEWIPSFRRQIERDCMAKLLEYDGALGKISKVEATQLLEKG